jgi:hypothetical protein
MSKPQAVLRYSRRSRFLNLHVYTTKGIGGNPQKGDKYSTKEILNIRIVSRQQQHTYDTIIIFKHNSHVYLFM